MALGRLLQAAGVGLALAAGQVGDADGRHHGVGRARVGHRTGGDDAIVIRAIRGGVVDVLAGVAGRAGKCKVRRAAGDCEWHEQ